MKKEQFVVGNNVFLNTLAFLWTDNRKEDDTSLYRPPSFLIT